MQLFESRVDFLIQESDTLFEQGLLIWRQHGNNPVCKRGLVAGGDKLRRRLPFVNQETGPHQSLKPSVP
jgi:hypothetical protein